MVQNSILLNNALCLVIIVQILLFHCGQGNGIGDAADTCSTVAEAESPEETSKATEEVELTPLSSPPPVDVIESTGTVMRIHRSESYRHIIEATEAECDEERNAFFFNRFKPTAKFVNIERVPKSKSIKM